MIKKQRGVTLIELMVSMMLGLALVAGISQLFIQSQKSFTLQRNISDMTDDGAFLLEVLAKGVLQAGFEVTGDTGNFGASAASEFDSGMSFNCGNVQFYNPNKFKNKCEFIKGGQRTTIGLLTDVTNDAFVYRYKLSDLNELNNFLCTSKLDTHAAIGDMVTAYIYVDKDTKSTRPTFYCKAKTSSYSGQATQPLAYDVEKLVVKYGVHIKKENTNVPDTFYFTDAATIDAENNWKNVFAVKMFIVLRSTDKNLTRNKTGWSIEGGATDYPAVDEKRIYKVFSKTIFLRASEQ